MSADRISTSYKNMFLLSIPSIEERKILTAHVGERQKEINLNGSGNTVIGNAIPQRMKTGYSKQFIKILALLDKAKSAENTKEIAMNEATDRANPTRNHIG